MTMQEKNEMSQILRGIMDCVAYSKRYRAKHGAGQNTENLFVRFSFDHQPQGKARYAGLRQCGNVFLFSFL